MSRPRAFDRLQHAAFSQFVTVGADSLTMEGIAQRAGVSIGAAYRSFPALEDAVHHALSLGLPPLAERITATRSLDPWLPPPAQEDRLVTESLLAVRRFPSVTPVVAKAMSDIARAIEPIGVAALVGCQAIMLAGCSIPSRGRGALARLYERLRTTSPTGPLPWSPPESSEFASIADLSEPADVDPIAERLISATTSVLAGRQEVTVRSIARSAGLTTGAIYRRYESKDQLIADTIRAHLTSDRTAWAIPFVARLAGTESGDPAEILAQQLALAGDGDADQTRLAVEFLVASRVSPDARQVLVKRITEAQAARESLFAAMLLAGIFSRDDTPLALSWALQVTPTGARLMSLVSPQPSINAWLPVTGSMLRAL